MKKEQYNYDSIWAVSIEFTKNAPIWVSNKERKGYINREYEETKALENKTEFDKHRLTLLSKLV